MTMPMLSHSNSLMDEDPGMMSEAETSATGFRRGSKQRATLPVVRTPSKTLERPLGLVFLQFRHETKRALLPNEITTLDTVRALFVRSFARQLSMEYFDSNNVHIYIHDPNQDMFYELEDLRDIRDRSILRLFETDELKQPFNFQSALPISLSQLSFLDDGEALDANDLDQPLDRCNPRLMISSPLSSGTWDEMSYFSEPEFDSDYRPQHVHKAKTRTAKPMMGLANGRQSIPAPAAPVNHGSTVSLIQPPPNMPPRNLQGRSALHRSYSIAAEQTPSPLRIDRNAMSPVKLARDYATSVPSSDQSARWSEQHGAEVIHGFFSCSQQALPPQVPPRPPERSFHNYSNLSNLKPSYGASSSSLAIGSNAVIGPALSRSPVFGNGFNDLRNSQSSVFQSGIADPALVDEQTRKRMEQVERKLASLTGLVQTALTSAVGVHVQLSDNDLDSDTNSSGLPLRIPPAEPDPSSSHLLAVKTPRLGLGKCKDKCVSFEKSVSFCDDPVELHEGKHSPQPTESKPTKPAIKSSTLPRASSQVSVYKGDSDWIGSVETYTQLRLLQKNARELRSEMRSLRRLSQAQLSAVNEAVKDTIQIMKKTFLENSDVITNALCDNDSSNLETTLRNVHRQEDNYQKEMKQLEKDLSELETSVENLRSHVINKKTRVSMADVEQLATLLSRSSKSVEQLKTQFPVLEESIKGALTLQMGQQAEDNQFLTETPNKLENTIGRCKKLTSTLVTLRRLASVQEQRQPHTSEKSPTSKSYTTSVTVDTPSNVIRNPPQQGISWNEFAQQSDCNDAFTASLELYPTHRADVSEPGIVDATSRNDSRPFHQCGDQSQRTEPRSPNALDTLLDELKHYSETNNPMKIGSAEKMAFSNKVLSLSPNDMGSSQIVTAKTGSGQRAQSLQPTPAMQPILKPPVPTSTSYAESSVDSVVSSTCIDNPNLTSGRRRAPPPPPPRTSSRSPLASPLRTNHKFQPRPLPSLPATVENNHFTMPLVTTVTSVLPQSQARSTSILSADSKVVKTNKVRLPVPTQANEKLVESHEVLLRHKCASSANSSLSRRTSEADSNNMIITCGDSGVPLTLPGSPKRDTLESRHQELLKTQKHLQEQYDRLQRFHGTQIMPAPSVNDKLQLVVPPSSQCTAQVVSEAYATPERQFSLQTNTDRCASETSENKHFLNIENQAMINDVAIDNRTPQNVNQPKDHSIETKDQQTITSSIDADGGKGRDYTFISILLDNAHETDIL